MSMLRGPGHYFKHLFSREQWIFSTVYLSSLLLTLYAACVLRMTVPTAFFGAVQVDIGKRCWRGRGWGGCFGTLLGVNLEPRSLSSFHQPTIIFWLSKNLPPFLAFYFFCFHAYFTDAMADWCPDHESDQLHPWGCQRLVLPVQTVSHVVQLGHVALYSMASPQVRQLSGGGVKVSSVE